MKHWAVVEAVASLLMRGEKPTFSEVNAIRAIRTKGPTTRRQREIPEGIERGETSTSHPTNEFVDELRQLQGYAWIDLRLKEDYQTRGQKWCVAAYTLTPAGREALEEERGRGRVSPGSTSVTVSRDCYAVQPTVAHLTSYVAYPRP